MSESIIVQEPAFNENLLHCGVAVRLEGCDFDGDDVTGNYIVERILEVGTLKLVGCLNYQTITLTIDVEDINNGLKLTILHGVK